MQKIPSLYYALSDLGGRGVFTAADVPEQSLLEICPVIVMPREHLKHLDQTGLYDYYFLWGEQEDSCAVALGYGSLYNHSYRPNAVYLPDFEGQALHIIALRNLQAGEEITVNYNGHPGDGQEVWFMARRLGEQ